MTWQPLSSPGTDALRYRQNGHWTLYADGAVVRVADGYSGAGSTWFPRDLRSAPTKPGEGGSCGFRACPPPQPE